MTEHREYENGVADVLAFLVGSDALVERDVRLPGRLSGTERQVDIVVRGRIFGLSEATLAVDCKRWGSKVDVRDIGAFLDLIDDIGVELGLLVTTAGASKAAQERVQRARGARVHVVTLEELRAWRPPGTVGTAFRLPSSQQSDAERALRRVGFRVTLESRLEWAEDEIVLDAFRHYGNEHPSGEQQAEHADAANRALKTAGIPATLAASGVTVAGGTPAHRWLDVIDATGRPLGIRVLAATEEDVERELQHLAQELRAPRAALSVARPPGWPVKGVFGLS